MVDLQVQETDRCANVLPMEQWIKETPETEELCPPCLLAPLASWYTDTLREAGESDLAEMVNTEASSPDTTPERLAKTLDSVKGQVPQTVSESLRSLDCSVQMYDPKEETANG